MDQALFEPIQANTTDQQGVALNWSAVMLVPIPVWVFFGNLTVLVVIAEHASLRRIWSNRIIFSLAVTDMSISLLVMPFAALTQLCDNYWPFPFAICVFHVISDVYFCSTSIMHLMLIAVNRYAAIGWPMSYRRVNHATGWQALLLLGVWSLPMVIISPLVIHIFINPEGIYQESHCAIFYDSFILYGSISTFYFPLLIMIAVDIRSFFLLRSKNRTSERLKSISKVASLAPAESSVSEHNQQINPPLNYEHSSTSSGRLGHYFRKRSCTDQGAMSRPCPRLSMAPKSNGSSPNNSNNIRRNHSCPQNVNETEANHSTLQVPDETAKNDRRDSHLHLRQLRKSVSTIMVTPVKDFFRRQRAETALLTVFIVFVICWVPFFTINILQTIVPSIKDEGTLFLIFDWLGFCSSGFNPIVYPIFNGEYRKCFMRTFGSSRRRRRRGAIDMHSQSVTSKSGSDARGTDCVPQDESTSPSETVRYHHNDDSQTTPSPVFVKKVTPEPSAAPDGQATTETTTAEQPLPNGRRISIFDEGDDDLEGTIIISL